ncbi:MAG: sporulation protein YabP [Clostridia bacterium]|nr:sporulation protein YabP [Clostridia bacterium]
MRDNDSPHGVRPHGLTLEGRQKAVITGVEGVDSFNEQMVVLATTAGTLTLLGNQLHVSKLNLEDGQLLVDGEIAALEYDERSRPGRGSLLTRLFR